MFKSELLFRTCLFKLAFVVVCGFTILHPETSQASNCAGNTRVCKGIQAKYMYRGDFVLDSNKTYTMELNNFTPSSYPMMYLMNTTTNESLCVASPNGQLVQMTVGNSSGCNLPSGTNLYRLVIFSLVPESGGVGNLYVEEGGVTESYGQISFSGDFWYVDVKNKDKIQTAHQTFHGKTDTILMMMDQVGKITKFDDDGASVDYLSRMANTSGSDLGYQIVLLGAYSASSEGKVNIYRNDASDDSPTPQLCEYGDDADCDGLGDKLELELGTCPCIPGASGCFLSQVVGTSCKYKTTYAKFNPKDSDGDGLPDFWEVLGKPTSSIAFSLSLPKFGVSPTRKDILLEVDWTTVFYAANDQPLSVIAARQLIKTFAIRKAGSADSLRNPDGSDGVSIHIDSNNLSKYPNPDIQDPNPDLEIELDDSKSTYGDWFGSAEVPVFSGKEELKQTGLDYMPHWRRGVFRYIVMHNDGEGRVYDIGEWIIKSGKTGVGGDELLVRVTAHELGHSLGIYHGGTKIHNCKPNYPSIMNYGYGYTRPPFERIYFSKGKLYPLNPSSINELNPIGPTSTVDERNELQVVLSWLKGVPFYYDVEDVYNPQNPSSYGRVNWNRDVDVFFNPSYTSSTKCKLRNPALKYCNYVKDSSTNLGLIKRWLDNAKSSGGSNFSGKLQSYGNDVYLFFVDNSLRMNYSKISGQTLGAIQTLSIQISEDVSAHEFEFVYNGTSSNKLVVAYRGLSSNDIKYGFIENGQWENVGLLVHSAYDVSLVRYLGSLYAFYTKSNREVFYKYMNGNGIWSSEYAVADANGVLKSRSRPSFTINTLDSKLYGSFTTISSNKVFLVNWNGSILSDWHTLPSTIFTFYGGAPEILDLSRTSLVFDGTTEHPKKFFLFYVLKSTGEVQLMTSTYKGLSFEFDHRIPVKEKIKDKVNTSPSAILFNGNVSYFSSNRFFSSSVFLGVEQFYHPKADGIRDLELKDSNDWETIANGICMGIAKVKNNENDQDVLYGAGCSLCVAPGGTCQ